MNLKSYITKEDYTTWAGPDWPSFDNLLSGNYTVNDVIQKEVEEFINLHVKKGTVFPIRTATACQRKWTESVLWLNDLSSSDCQVIKPVKFELKDFDSFHNLPRKIKDRQTMLKGEWPDNGCSHCQNVEESGGFSDRLEFLNHRGYSPKELETDPTAVNVSPRILQIWAQNTCNMSCIYCNSNFSSQIEKENLKYGEFKSGGVHIPVKSIPAQTVKEYFDRLVIWLDQHITTLSKLMLLGGETLLQHELMTAVLDVLDRHPSPNLEFGIYSNFNVPENVWNRYVPRILDLQKKGHIKYFDLTASIDCWGPEAEYVRSGLDLNKFEQRFAWAADQDPDSLRLFTCTVITPMTIKTMPELFEKIKQYSKNRHIGQWFTFYLGSNYPFLHPNIFAYSTWEKDFEKILKMMPSDTVDQREAIPRMIGLQKYLQQSVVHKHDEIKKLHVYLDELDRRRGTDWQKLFPYLKV